MRVKGGGGGGGGGGRGRPRRGSGAPPGTPHPALSPTLWVEGPVTENSQTLGMGGC